MAAIMVVIKISCYLLLWYRGTSLIRKRPPPLRPYSNPMPRAKWCS